MPVMGPAQQNVTRAVRLLMTDRFVSSEELSPILGITAEAVRSKRSGRRPWTLDETCALAQHFDVPVASLLNGSTAALFGANGDAGSILQNLKVLSEQGKQAGETEVA